MLETCEPVSTHSKFGSFSSPSNTPQDEGERLLTLTSSLLKDESLCAWNSDLFKDDGYFRNKQNSKKLAMLKSSVIGLNVKKTNSTTSNKHRLGKNNSHPREENNNNNRNECSFVHYTDSRQYVEEYRKSKLSRMTKQLESEDADGYGRDNGEFSNNNEGSPSYSKINSNCESRRTYPVVSLQSYEYMTLGYRFDEAKKSKCSIKDIPSELKRDMLSCVQIRRGKCLDQHENDPPLSSNSKPGVTNTKQMSICNISAYDNVCLTEKTFIRSRDLQPEASLQCKKIMDKTHHESHRNLNAKTPHLKNIKVRSAEQRRNCHKPSNCMNSSEYCHIIKRVLGHCDTSRLSFHGTKETATSPSCLITTS